LTAKTGSHGFLDLGEIDLARDGVDWDGVEFDLQIRCTFVERRVGGCGNDPKRGVRLSMNASESPYISGSVIPLVARAQSRWALTAMMILSVPPEVIVPAPVGLLNIL
jgi:hypothetical protein